MGICADLDTQNNFLVNLIFAENLVVNNPNSCPNFLTFSEFEAQTISF